MFDAKDIFGKKIIQAVKASTLEVQEEARSTHAYKQRNGALFRATDTAFSN